MRVVFASGKGGTGKTLLATNLAYHLSTLRPDVVYADADVEEPNGHLFLRPSGLETFRVAVPVPELAAPHCSGCGECQDFCDFNAILSLKDGVAVFEELCHGCGGCVLACPERVLVEKPREIGSLSAGRAGKLSLVMATLDVGEARAVPLMERLIRILPEQGLVILDAPPGTSCPAVTAVRGADLAVLVTEPTPFGLHDLRLAVEMCRVLDVPARAVINRSDLGDDEVRAYLDGEGIEVLAEIPFERGIAEAYASGRMAVDMSPALQAAVKLIARGMES